MTLDKLAPIGITDTRVYKVYLVNEEAYPGSFDPVPRGRYRLFLPALRALRRLRDAGLLVA